MFKIKYFAWGWIYHIIPKYSHILNEKNVNIQNIESLTVYQYLSDLYI